jgi:ABC-type multidrug transport system ATPase subunit
MCGVQVVEALKKLADEGHTVIAAIHQPRSRIFELFDDLLLLSQGRLVYGGEAGAALDHFAERGYECPQHYNPAEFLADLISVDNSSGDVAEESGARLDQLVAATPGAFALVVEHCCTGSIAGSRQWEALLQGRLRVMYPGKCTC